MTEYLDFTVAIPSYNGETRLPELLKRLQNQIHTENLSWEIIIVDNNSTDNTAAVIKTYQASWQHPYPLKYFFEAQQGAAWARLRAVQEAKGQLIGFLDDDNLPAPDWVQQGVAFGKEYPQAGAWGSQIHGDFEVKPPENFARIQNFLAIRERGEKPNLYEPQNLSLPPGAAIVVRKQAWCDNVPSRPVLSGKIPGLMIQGDDYEPLLHIHRGGWQIWYNPTMHTYHQIPHWRLEKDYLLSLARGCGLCIYQLRLINAKNWQKPILFVRTILGNLRRFLLLFLKYRGEGQSDVIALCEMEFYWSSMISPFYLLKRIGLTHFTH
ncbi:MAG: hormogonium polysaccharide biosynthesis glycosyltransferase HpsE [Stigonema ocellatum SAG 48.90 = DSM 106950]|nr:hormogonium polysaccharide biosynthesis glycosyltransferase HpsE [Stigonema ocellatum SAG 48.90 = DSM 106950]